MELRITQVTYRHLKTLPGRYEHEAVEATAAALLVLVPPLPGGWPWR